VLFSHISGLDIGIVVGQKESHDSAPVVDVKEGAGSRSPEEPSIFSCSSSSAGPSSVFNSEEENPTPSGTQSKPDHAGVFAPVGRSAEQNVFGEDDVTPSTPRSAVLVASKNIIKSPGLQQRQCQGPSE
ncbi:unnamed protein product, partial [Amoebophrya sp. A25]